jgi:uncharacterized protein with HEPN domain
MQRDDTAYLLDILIAANKALNYLHNLTFREFEKSELHQDAVMRALEIIGEAANRVSKGMKEAHPEIPWNQITGMRNRLVHEYFRINLSAVWDTVHRDIPELVKKIEPLVPEEDEFRN